MDVKDMVWAFTHKLKDAFPIVSISFDEVSERPTTVEHHGGVEIPYIIPKLTVLAPLLISELTSSISTS